LVVLTHDAALFDSIRSAVGDRHPAWRAPTSEEAVDMLLLGRCGVLIVDMAAVSMHPTSLIEQIHTQFPDVVVVVAGDRDDEPALAGLVGEGLIYRYMHKPLSEKRATMFLGAAIRHYTDRRGAHVFEPLLPLVGRLPDKVQRRYWIIAGSVIVAVVVAVAVLTHEREPRSQLLPAPSATATAARPPATDIPRADPVLSRARAALDAERYESPAGRNALDLYQAVLLAKPDNVEAKTGLERTISAILAAADTEWRSGDAAEAERLIDRVLAVEPGHQAAEALLARVRPPQPVEAPAAAAVEKPVDAGTPDAYRVAGDAEAPAVAAEDSALPADEIPTARENPAAPPEKPDSIAAATATTTSAKPAAAPERTAPPPTIAVTGVPAAVAPVAAAKVPVRRAPTAHAAANTVPKSQETPRPAAPASKVAAPTLPDAKAVAKAPAPAPKAPATTPSATKAVASAPVAQLKAASRSATTMPTAVPAPTIAPLAKPEPEKPKVSTKPVPDPLQPRLAMSSPTRSKQKVRSYGAPISTGLPVAGYETRRRVAEPPSSASSSTDSSAPDASYARSSASSRAARPEFVDSSDLEQLVAVDPVYPAAAMRDRIEGWVTLEFTVTPAGGVNDILVTDSEPNGVFDAAATRAVSQWRFKPRVSGGRAVAMRSSVTLRFGVAQ